MDNLNIYNANSQISKTLMEKEKKFAKNRAEFLAEADRKMREETSGKIAKEKALAESAARFAISSTVAKSKARTQSLNEEIDYTNRASIIGMASHITNIVCESLLLDESELSNIYPEYKEDINNIVKGLLENGDLAEEISNPVSIALMESVSNKMPSVKEGKYLTEEELRTIITDELPTNVTAKIKDLTGNISSKVASLIEKEEVNAKEIEKDVKAANAANKEKEAAASTPVEDDEGVVAEEDRVPEDEVPAEDEEETIEEVPEESTVTAPISKTLKIMPDGTISLKINEDASNIILVKETPRNQLIESLAVNEAMNQISSGKEYNRDLCLSKAIIMVTITETFNAMGLMEVNDHKYAEMISEAGGIPGIGKISSMPKTTFRKKITKESKNKTVKAPISKSGNLSESILVSQYKPRLNTADPNSMAERLRQKRLLQEQERQNQTENLSE